VGLVVVLVIGGVGYFVWSNIPSSNTLTENRNKENVFWLTEVSTHAIEKHGSDITSAAQQCFDKNGIIKTMTNPLTKRKADICQGDLFYVNITEDNGDPVTTFAKEKMKILDKVIKYLSNVGYQ
jgi:hypothetical protein